MQQRSNIVEFEGFRLFSSARRLEKDGIPVKIGSRALDILISLVDQRGQPVSNKTLIERVWRGMVVEDNTLRVNIACLRRTLSDSTSDSRYIATIPGQGYCFVAPLSDARIDGALARNFYEAARPSYSLPSQLRAMVGRSELVAMLAAQLQSQRFVTIVGPGGIGKTTTAIAIAHALRADFDEEVCFIDLAALTAPQLLADTVLAVLDLPATSNPQFGLAFWLRDRKFLLILDNCEHVIDAVSALAEQLYHAAPRLYILATSREALRAEGEYAHRLPPLAYPPEGASLNAAQALDFSAVQLFVGHAEASGAPCGLSDANAPLVAQICRKLDGIALAIELSASRVVSLGVQGVADLVNNGLFLSCPGRRTALPRHQTLHAMLDWSYALLPEYQRTILRRLAVFVGRFSLKAAVAVAGDTAHDQPRVIAALDSLVAQSLVCAEVTSHGIAYRLLESTRVYAMEKLIASGEAPLAAQRNAGRMFT